MSTQSEKRQEYLNLILDSESEKKLIVAGPGTGKTYAFKQILNKLGPGNYLVLSFIRKLVNDLGMELGDTAEVKTFHAFCKRILHETKGKVDIYSKLPEIIQKDAELLDHDYSDFETKFRNLEESSPEVNFFITRGDYYEYLSFDDSVYRLYQLLKEDNSIIDNYDQIIVDEYQDFNKLEVEFLIELEKKGPILIAGDDDQAIYEDIRSSSPNFLRGKYNSGEYDIFELPYSSRCTEVVVNAVNAFISEIDDVGGFEDRIAKQYLSFKDGSEELNRLYPKLKLIAVPVIPTIAKYIDIEIQKIPKQEIIESNTSDSSYPTALIIGQKHYLSELQKILIRRYPQIEFDTKSDEDYNKILDGIRILIKDNDANLGWRLLAAELLSSLALKSAVIESQKSTSFKEILKEDFTKPIVEVINVIKNTKEEIREFSHEEKKSIIEVFQENADIVIKYFTPSDEEIVPDKDIESPTILLRTFEGSKGLSGGHVFIVGANDGSIPKYDSDGQIRDIEYCKFIVALTRTRKQCHLISNRWLNTPVDKGGKYLDRFNRSTFLGLIPSEFIDDQGYKRSGEIE